MGRTAGRLIGGVLAVVAAASVAPGATLAQPPLAAPAAPARSGDPVWAATFKDLTDTPQPLAQWRGKVAVVYFFATWCIPCHLETPKLVKLQQRFAKGAVVIGIALDNADKVRAFATKYAVPYPVVYGGREAIQLGRDLGNTLGAVPFTVVIDRAGAIVETITGDTPDGKLEALLAPLVG